MEDIPIQFLCPITMEIMKEPIICEDGNTYDKSSIEAYNKPISPLLGTPMDLSIKIPNRVIKELIFNFMNRIDINNNNDSNNNIQLNNINDIQFNNANDDSNKINKINKILNIEEIFKNIHIEITNNNYIKKTLERLHKIEIIEILKPTIFSENIEELLHLFINDVKFNEILYLYAIIYKKSKILKFFIENNYPISKESINIAILYGNKDLILWLLQNNVTWDIYTFSYALNTKNLNFLKWLKNENCFWGVLLDEHRVFISNEINNWLKSSNCPWCL